MVTSPVTGKDGNVRLRAWWRHWSVVLILAVLAGLVVWAMLNLVPWLKNLQEWRAARTAREQIKQIEMAYRDDKYGGKTPEETFDMFIAALEKGDIDLASKYFVLNKQDNWKKTLEEYKNKALLSDFVFELKNTEKSWKKNQIQDPNVVEFYSLTNVETDSTADFNGQKIKIPAGEYSNTTRFEKYPNGVWKIGLL